MNQFTDVQSFVRDVRAAESIADITLVLSDATRRFNFDHFAMVQRVSSRLALAPVKLSELLPV